MAKKDNKEYALKNKAYMRKVETEDDTVIIERGVLYKVINKGEGTVSPGLNDVVSVRYEGRLISGEVFDTTLENNYPETFRVREVIEGWQKALSLMHIGDKWEIFLSADKAYGKEKTPGIPINSTLIFTVELMAIN